MTLRDHITWHSLTLRDITWHYMTVRDIPKDITWPYVIWLKYWMSVTRKCLYLNFRWQGPDKAQCIKDNIWSASLDKGPDKRRHSCGHVPELLLHRETGDKTRQVRRKGKKKDQILWYILIKLLYHWGQANLQKHEVIRRPRLMFTSHHFATNQIFFCWNLSQLTTCRITNQNFKTTQKARRFRCVKIVKILFVQCKCMEYTQHQLTVNFQTTVPPRSIDIFFRVYAARSFTRSWSRHWVLICFHSLQSYALHAETKKFSNFACCPWLGLGQSGQAWQFPVAIRTVVLTSLKVGECDSGGTLLELTWQLSGHNLIQIRLAAGSALKFRLEMGGSVFQHLVLSIFEDHRSGNSWLQTTDFSKLYHTHLTHDSYISHAAQRGAHRRQVTLVSQIPSMRRVMRISGIRLSGHQ